MRLGVSYSHELGNKMTGSGCPLTAPPSATSFVTSFESASRTNMSRKMKKIESRFVFEHSLLQLPPKYTKSSSYCSIMDTWLTSVPTQFKIAYYSLKAEPNEQFWSFPSWDLVSFLFLESGSWNYAQSSFPHFFWIFHSGLVLLPFLTLFLFQLYFFFVFFILSLLRGVQLKGYSKSKFALNVEMGLNYILC